MKFIAQRTGCSPFMATIQPTIGFRITDQAIDPLSAPDRREPMEIVALGRQIASLEREITALKIQNENQLATIRSLVKLFSNQAA